MDGNRKINSFFSAIKPFFILFLCLTPTSAQHPSPNQCINRMIFHWNSIRIPSNFALPSELEQLEVNLTNLVKLAVILFSLSLCPPLHLPSAPFKTHLSPRPPSHPNPPTPPSPPLFSLIHVPSLTHSFSLSFFQQHSLSLSSLSLSLSLSHPLSLSLSLSLSLYIFLSFSFFSLSLMFLFAKIL